jgi:hypothetical protein
MLQELTGVRSSIVQAAAGQMTNLPVMSSAELCALNALTHPVLDKTALDWWASQDDQKNLTQMAYSELARRQLYDPATRHATVPLDLVLSARANPSFIMVTRDKAGAEPRSDRLYGASDDFGNRAVLLEQVKPNPTSWSGPAYSYEPTRVQPQADAITEWASARKGRVIEFYMPGSGFGSRVAERVTVLSPVRKGEMSYHRETTDSTFRRPPICLTAFLVGLMASIPYLPPHLPVSF